MICEALVNKAWFQRSPVQFKVVSNTDNIWVKQFVKSMMKCLYKESAINVEQEKLFHLEHLGEMIQVSQEKSVTIEWKKYKRW